MNLDLREEILRLRDEKNAIILAHFYQTPDIQEIADFVGDSLELARKAAETDARIIVFAGVYFMAETAKILNPEKKVLLPDLKAGCSLADGCPPEPFEKFIHAHPGHTVVSYVNSPARVKALSDWICTSSNAERVINAIPEDQDIIFAPDRNLGKYLMSRTGRKMVTWDGVCTVHQAFALEKIGELMKENPEARLIAHPESDPAVLKVADHIGSTKSLLEYVQHRPESSFIVATEAGILHKMQMAAPNATLIPAPIAEDNACACSECAFMKVNTLEKLYRCLRDETPEIQLDEDLLERARVPLDKMLELV